MLGRGRTYFWFKMSAMYVQQLYTNCLAHAAYYIECDKEAAVIDPLRNPEPYVALAAERGARIRYVLETHFHADFVSGHIDLANQTGATIVFGPNATPEYKAYIARDGESLHLGHATIEILHTPGHTVESTCFLLHEKGHNDCLFSGDTLFVGDVGRPDLLSGNLSKETLAAMMYDSLKAKIKTLSDETVVYPGHGAGSACGKNIGISRFSTIGEERKTNYALLIDDKDEFVRAVTSGLPVAPGYFFKDAALNKKGAEAYEAVLQRGLNPLSAEAFAALHSGGASVLDTRNADDFAAGFIEGALNIGLNGDFAVWAGHFLSADQQILLVTDQGKEREAIERLGRIGFDNVVGYLEGGMRSWFAGGHSYMRVATVNSEEMGELINVGQYELLDVRNRSEVAKNRVPGAIHIPLSELREECFRLDTGRKWLIYCAGGYRSMIAASFLCSRGYPFIASLEGGINALAKAQPEVVEVGLETE
jgi:hydroxyacylglutathione hydrolase